MREIPITPELRAALEQQRKLFVEKFGREPGPDDPVIFDPDEDEPKPMPLEKAQAILESADEKAGGALREMGLLD